AQRRLRLGDRERYVLLRRVSIRQDCQPRHIGHRGLRDRRDAGSEPAQPVPALFPAGGDSLLSQRLPCPAGSVDCAGDRAGCPDLPLYRTPHYPPLATLPGARECERAGGGEWDYRREELPAGTEHVRRIYTRQRAVVPGERALRLCLQRRLSAAVLYRQPGHDGGGLLRRAQRARTCDLSRGLVPLCAEHGPALVSPDQHCLFLEPVPAWSFGQRARFRPARHGAACSPERERAGWTTARENRVSPSLFQL